MTEKRGRGRPTGSGKNDTPHLRKVAALLIENATMKPTTAMNKVIWAGEWTESEPTLRRRWQVKWKTQGADLIAEARQAREAKRQEQAQRNNSPQGSAGYSVGNSMSAYDIIRSVGASIENMNPAYLGIRNTLQAISNLPMTDIERLDPLGNAMRKMQESFRLADINNKIIKDHANATSLARMQRLIEGKGY